MRQNQARRIDGIALSARNYLSVTAVLAVYAWIGSVGWSVPLAYATVTMLGSAAFVAAVRTGVNLRLSDPNLFAWQMAFGGMVVFGFLTAVPGLAFLFLSGMFVTAAFGLVQFTLRQFSLALAIAAVAAACVFALVGQRLALPASTPAEIGMLWVCLFGMLLRFMTVATHVGALRGKLTEKNELLQQSLRRIQEMVDHDDLTGALARRRFMQVATGEVMRSVRNEQVFCIGLLDLDNFKQVNDQHGHLIGDQVLKRFCDIVQTAIRTVDQLGRYGGEEFALLLPALTRAHAPALVDRVVDAVAREPWADMSRGLAVTVSIGVAEYRAGDTVESMLDRADAALYRAKAGGRARAEFALTA